MRLLALAFLSFFAWQCQTSKPSHKKQVTIDLTDKQISGFLEYSTKKLLNLNKGIAAGGYHSCGIREDNTAVCWGWNQFDQAKASKTLICSGASQEACDFTDGCIWDPSESGGHCISKHWVACNWVKSQDACIDVGCHWLDEEGSCISKSWLCNSAKSANACNKIPGCGFDHGLCMNKYSISPRFSG